MSINVIFECDRCHKTEKGTSRIFEEFVFVSGKSYGPGEYHELPASSVAPDGWVPFDAIGCTYCPDCADEIFETKP